MKKVVSLTLTYLIYSVGTVIVFGFLFQQIHTINESILMKSFGINGVIATGAIGTVVHEISHLIMAILFAHDIVDVELFRPIAAQGDGVLGFVSHTYNSKSIYQSVGNFFIGVAPLIGGTITVQILMNLLLPEQAREINRLNKQTLSETNMLTVMQLMIKNIIKSIKILFIHKDVLTVKFLIFIILTYSIVTHMGLSGADLSGALSGFLVIVCVSFMIASINTVLNLKSVRLTLMMTKYNCYVIAFFLISLMTSIVTVIISTIVYIILR